MAPCSRLSRGRTHIEQVLNESFNGTLISDGYAAYARYAEQQEGVTHAQCWVHSRRYFIDAQNDHPERATEALQQIAKLYQNEETLRAQKLAGEKKRQYRLEHSKPVVSDFFQWCRDQMEQGGLLPCDPLTKALNYVLSREGPAVGIVTKINRKSVIVLAEGSTKQYKISPGLLRPLRDLK